MSLEFHDITLSDKALFDAVTDRNENSKFSFAQSFAWKDSHKLKIASAPQGYIFLSLHPEFGVHLVSPILFDRNAEIAPLIERGERYMLENYGYYRMKFVSRAMMDRIERDMPGRYRFEPDAASSEYIYSTASLINLSGKKLHSKRNLINSFTSEFPSYEYLPYTPDLFEACMDVQREWTMGKDLEDDFETAAIERTLKNYEYLGVEGGVITAEGRVLGFSVGERLTDKAALILFEKGLPGVGGIYQTLCRDTAEKIFPDTELLNRGEDMGLPGLRQAKRSYRPLYQLEKFDSFLK